MQNKSVLVVCEESQTVCLAFRMLGKTAYSCDIKPCSGGFEEFHLQMDAFDAIAKIKPTLLIAHPPCTYLSAAGAPHLFYNGGVNEERLNNLIAARQFFMRLYSLDVPHICVENPRPLKAAHLPKPTQHIEPYYFGEPYKKFTFLWLKNLPLLKPTKLLNRDECISCEKAKWFNCASGTKRQEMRSKTFTGIANAMANQWKFVVE